MNILLAIDEFEPQEIEALLRQSIPLVVRSPLNRNGIADYSWRDEYGLEHFERKQTREVLASLESVEYQLIEELKASPRLTLIVEGIAVPAPDGIDTFVMAKNGRLMRPSTHSKLNYAAYEGWLVALEHQGIRVWRTPSLNGTAEALTRFYHRAIEGKTDILLRHLKVPVGFHPDPYVQSLMGIKNGGVGPKFAEQLIELFRTPEELMRQAPETIAYHCPEFGLTRARKLLQAWGRDV